METERIEILTVAQLTRRVKTLLEERLGLVWVAGEISNWKVAASGHAYFTLKDKESQIDAVMFRGRLSRLRFAPENGLEVVAHGRVSVYERRGNYQIVLDDMQPKGVGALQLAFDQLKKKLEAEGLFDPAHKKPLPVLPRRIGVVTSPTGAAIRDILNVIHRRFAGVHVILYPARVQGREAAPEIAAGIRALDRWGVDVMIVGRGGGSMEDLWPFNEETVVRAVHAAQTPIISAVGHEIDFTLTDFAADLRAPTPSAAAELVVRERAALAEQVGLLHRRLETGFRRHLEQARHRLSAARRSFVFQRPEELVRQLRQTCDEMRLRLEAALANQARAAHIRLDRAARGLALLSPRRQAAQGKERHAALAQRLLRAGAMIAEQKRTGLRPALARLAALNPLAILSRGYAIAWKLPERTLVRSATAIAPDDTIYMRFGIGAAEALVRRIEESNDGADEKGNEF